MIEHGPVERHDFAIRTLTVSALERIGVSFVRVTLTGDSLAGFTSTGPADHVKVFFADPATGVLTVPEVGPDGIRRPNTGTVITRDYTPREFRAATDGRGPELDLDFVLHGDNGPASAWAGGAAVGDTLVVGGPRGSRPAPTGMTRVILGADETALPAVSHWIRLLPAEVEIHAFIEIAHDFDASYLVPQQVHRADVIWLAKGEGALERAIRGLGEIDGDTFVWVAGEAASLVPIRRYLRRELGLPKHQVKVDGYWKSGEAGRDHHAPIDPSDTED